MARSLRLNEMCVFCLFIISEKFFFFFRLLLFRFYFKRLKLLLILMYLPKLPQALLLNERTNERPTDRPNATNRTEPNQAAKQTKRRRIRIL